MRHPPDLPPINKLNVQSILRGGDGDDLANLVRCGEPVPAAEREREGMTAGAGLRTACSFAETDVDWLTGSPVSSAAALSAVSAAAATGVSPAAEGGHSLVVRLLLCSPVNNMHTMGISAKGGGEGVRGRERGGRYSRYKQISFFQLRIWLDESGWLCSIPHVACRVV